MKKSGIYDRTKVKSGVVDGGIDSLVKKIKKKEIKLDYEGDLVRIAIQLPSVLRANYKSYLAQKEITIQDDILEHIRKTLEKK